MTSSGTFLDSNILCYLFGTDPTKADKAGQLLAEHPTISIQVLAEICNVASRNALMSWPEIEEFVSTIEGLAHVVPMTLEMHHAARKLAAVTQYTIYDSQIVAAAAFGGCSTVLSEDMQDGRVYTIGDASVRVVNPFVQSNTT
jgi:predicted nucleic acid-binding protein